MEGIFARLSLSYEECHRLPPWLLRRLSEAEHAAAAGQVPAAVVREAGRPAAVVIIRATVFEALLRHLAAEL